MEVKTEENMDLRTSTVCSTCLSLDRRTCGVESVSYAYGLMTDWAPQDGARVCWECRALLARVLRFKVQALRAKQSLESASFTDNVSGKCMSRLSINTQSVFSTNPDFIPNSSYEFQKVEVDSEVEDSSEVWAEEITDDIKPVVEIAAKEVRSEEPQKRKRRKNKHKSEAKKTRKRKRDEIMELFKVTKAELDVYKENIFPIVLRSSNYQCKMCIEGFKYEVNWKRHNATFHSEEAGAFVCEICTSRFKSQELLTQHRSKHFQLFRCRYPSCSYVQHKRRSLTQHYGNHMVKQHSEERLHGQYSGDIYECAECGKVCTQRKQLVFHIKSHTKRVMCELCSYKCSNVSQLRIHTLAHLGPSHRKFECERCQMRFATRSKLIYHSRTHTGERPFQCETCGRAFVCKEFLTHHVKKKHQRGLEKEKKNFLQPRTKSFFINRRGVQKSEDLSTERKDHTCDICNKTFKFHSLLQNHIRYVHNGERTHACNICKTKFTTKHILDAHMGTHSDERPFKCDLCVATFKYKAGLKVHKVTHDGEKPFQCSICSAKYSTKYSLELHMCSHSDKRAFKCEQCDSTFKYESSLRDHKVIHKGERPFKCDECNATFKYKTNVAAHKLIHKGEKPHQCNICGTSFTLKGNLTCHMKIHSNVRPFECNVCSKTFAWKRNLNNHFKTHSK